MPRLRPIFLIEGYLLLVVGCLMGLPTLVDLAQGNNDWHVFVVSGATTLFMGGALVATCWERHIRLDLRQGFVLTTTSWLLISAFSALPFFFSSLNLDFTDGFFEAISGLTTTGSTVLTGLDSMPPGILLWRSLLQWIGGVGIIVMAVAMLPFLRVGGMQLFRTESSDRSDKALPRATQVAAAIILVYAFLTSVCALFYWLEGMTGFEAINHAMTTLSTGGYSTSDASMGHFPQPAIHWTSTLFMLLGSLPFVLYVKMAHGQFRTLIQDSQVRFFLLFVGNIVLALVVWQVGVNGVALPEALRHVAFNVASVISTTGYASTDYSLWGTFPVGVMLFLTVIGGCTGSTAGGIKIFRIQLLRLVGMRQFRRLLYRHEAVNLLYDGRTLSDDVVLSAGVFVFLFLAVIAILTVALTAVGLDLVTSLTGAATALANVGPGLGDIIGPAGNFSTLPDSAKWLLSVGMLLGRLEIFTVLVLLTPSFWRY